MFGRKNKCAPWHDDFKRNRKKLLINLHVLHPALRQSLSLCKTNLNTITLANFRCYSGEAIDLDSFCGNIISECEKTEEVLMNTWFKQITDIFDPQNLNDASLKGERRLRFYQCGSALLSIQMRDLLMRSVVAYVAIFADRRRLPRIEVDLVLHHNHITFSPSVEEILNMIMSVVSEINKLLREVPSMESWITGANNSFIPVTLDEEFVAANLATLKTYIEQWLDEPLKYAQTIRQKFNFLIDGTARFD